MEEIRAAQAAVDTLRSELATKEAELEAAMSTLPRSENLLFFYGDGCSFTKRVAPQVRCLEMKLGRSVTRLETWNDSANAKRYDEVGGKKRCGGVPFFYNTTTGSSVCGARACDILTKWAQSVEELHV